MKNNKREIKMSKTAIKAKNKNPLEEYLKKLSNRQCNYFVPDYPEDNREKVKILFILESPHKKEVEKRLPLVGATGKNVMSFLFEDNSSLSFGEYVKSMDESNIGIINVCNIPLQVVEQNKDDVKDIHKELNDLRESDQLNSTILSFFCDRIKEYQGVGIFVVCGGFAEKYFDEYLLKQKNNSILKKHYKGEIEILKVPHPSYGHWQFIEKHKTNLERLKTIFSKFEEK